MVNVHDKMNAEGRCRLCERPSAKGRKDREGFNMDPAGARQLTKHRLVPGRFGGRYEYANTVPLCVPCHRDVEAPDPVARRMLRTKLWSVEVAHILEHMGAVWLAAMYPKGAGPALHFNEADALAPEEKRSRLKERRANKPRSQAHSWTVGEHLRVTGQDNLQPWEAAMMSEKAAARARR